LSAGLVLDNSVFAAWRFSYESNRYTEGVFQAVAKDGGAVAPALWPVEVANALAIRRNLPIATQDDELIRAAKDVGVSLFQP